MTDGGSSRPEVHRLLATLVASKPAGRVAEIGTAFGEGTRAMADALGTGATLVSVEPDDIRHTHAREALAGVPVELLHVDGRTCCPTERRLTSSSLTVA